MKTVLIFSQLILFLVLNGKSQSITDIDGNVYKTIEIGSQEWMAENLKSTKYNDGSAIQNVTDGAKWIEISTPAYSWYENDSESYKDTFGVLYNGYTNFDKLCPEGWHIPSNDEWEKLSKYQSRKGGTLNIREYGYRSDNEGEFVSFGEIFFWTSTERHEHARYSWGTDESGEITGFISFKNVGLPVRCMKD